MPSKGISIVYMGTPLFAVPPLEALVENGFDVRAVVTVADKPSGRGRKLQSSAVKLKAEQLGLPVLQPTSLKDVDFLEELKALNADLFVVVAFRMLPQVVWSMPRLGTFNLHGSLLPELRGAAPIHWAIINGMAETGLTTFLLDEQIDTGSILLQEPITIDPSWTTGDLHDALMPLGATLVIKTAEGLENGMITSVPQNNTLASHAPKLTKENTALDFTKNPRELVNQIKGLSPFPGAHFNGYKFMNAAPTLELEKGTSTPKLTAVGKKLLLNYANGSVEILEIKPDGKRSMRAIDFINGMKTPDIQL
jgi:methionyl-tRNA formyltransferase